MCTEALQGSPEYQKSEAVLTLLLLTPDPAGTVDATV